MSSSGKQQTVQLPSLATLKGTSFDVRHLDSVGVILVDQPSLRGLYRLTFANGDAYVGQAINVANRFTSHRRRWEDITQFEFFPIPEGDLNQPEKDLIHLTEANGNVRINHSGRIHSRSRFLKGLRFCCRGIVASASAPVTRRFRDSVQASSNCPRSLVIRTYVPSPAGTSITRFRIPSIRKNIFGFPLLCPPQAS